MPGISRNVPAFRKNPTTGGRVPSIYPSPARPAFLQIILDGWQRRLLGVLRWFSQAAYAFLLFAFLRCDAAKAKRPRQYKEPTCRRIWLLTLSVEVALSFLLPSFPSRPTFSAVRTSISAKRRDAKALSVEKWNLPACYLRHHR